MIASVNRSSTFNASSAFIVGSRLKLDRQPRRRSAWPTPRTLEREYMPCKFTDACTRVGVHSCSEVCCGIAVVRNKCALQGTAWLIRCVFRMSMPSGPVEDDQRSGRATGEHLILTYRS